MAGTFSVKAAAAAAALSCLGAGEPPTGGAFEPRRYTRISRFLSIRSEFVPVQRWTRPCRTVRVPLGVVVTVWRAAGPDTPPARPVGVIRRRGFP